MSKKLLRLAMLLAACTLTFSACDCSVTGSSTGGSTGGGSQGGSTGNSSSFTGENSGDGGEEIGEVYEDYNPNKQPGDDQFDFAGNYVAPELTINGQADDAVWASTPVLATFGHGGAATVKVYRGELALFFLFNVSDSILLTEGTANDDSVTRSDSVELYLDTLANGGSKPQNDDYQLNLAAHGKTRIMQGAGNQWGNWNGLIDYEFTINGTLNDGNTANDTGYCAEVMVPYAQIGIEKDDTIGVAFGQVDKVSNAGVEPTVHWDWYGWEYGGVIVEPQTPNNYVLLDKNNQLLSRDEQEKPPADIAGYVIDKATSQPIEGATVTVSGGSVNKSTTTNAQGYYIIEDLDSNYTYTVEIAKAGYLSNSVEYSRDQMRNANGGVVTQENIPMTNADTVAKTKITGTVKNIVYGTVENATVSVGGTVLTAATDASGNFSIEGVPCEDDVTLTVTANGYAASTSTYAASTLTESGTSALGDVNLNLPYANTGSFGNKAATFADSTAEISRTLTGLEFNFTGIRQLVGKVELYIDTKSSTSDRNTDDTCWFLELFDDGKCYVHLLGTTQKEQSNTGVVWDISRNASDGYSAKLFIPYSALGMNPLDIFGFSLGQWSNSANDWDGWGYNGQFIAPEIPTQYVRVGEINNLYRYESNTALIELSGRLTDASNAGIGGVTVTVGSHTTTTGASGVWALKIPATTSALSVVYSRLGYATKTTNIAANYFNKVYSWLEITTLEEQKVTVTGKVTDSANGNGVEGVKVTVDGTSITATTSSDGTYTLNGVGTFTDALIRFEKNDYAMKEETITAETLSSLATHNLNTAIVSTNQIQYVTASGKVANVNGAVAGATVTVVGNSALTTTTDENGNFSIPNFAGVDCSLSIEKDGYIAKTVAFNSDSLTSGATTYDFGTTDLLLNYKELNGLIADKADTFAAFKGSFTRSAVGFEFNFVGTRAFTGQFELFVDTGTSAGLNARDTSDYVIKLKVDGTIEIDNLGGSNTSLANSYYTLTNASTTPTIHFTLPYSFLGINSTDVIGISLGQWSTSANNGAGDWDGWDNFAMLGENNEPFVKPENPQDYIRLGAHNEVYAASNNATLDLTSYEWNFGTGENTDTPAGALANAGTNADNFWGKVVSRDSTGVTFEFVTTGNFSTNGSDIEFINMYIDLGESAQAWTSVDYLVKIASDGTVYGRSQAKCSNAAVNGAAWWSATDADKLSTKATITTTNGVKKITYKVLYSDLGISANTVFGVCFREASHNATDNLLYDPWYDCYYKGARIDAAWTTQYTRIAADGTTYAATSNS